MICTHQLNHGFGLCKLFSLHNHHHHHHHKKQEQYLFLPPRITFHNLGTLKNRHTYNNLSKTLTQARAVLNPDQFTTTSPLQQQQGVEESVRVLKNAAKTRKVAADEVSAALSLIKKAKVDPTHFFSILGGTESPGRTWMLIFTTQGRLERGSYFPVTAVQRFDAAAKRIENGVYLGPIGSLTFEGRLSWTTRILAFVFEYLRIKIGPFDPLQIRLGKNSDNEREPGNNDPFFIWFYVDEEIAVAQGRGGGIAFWCRCRRVIT
ncbi:hypothetical protein AMTRI_Chr13g86730 [Amborella trichopoda]|uniref:Uncharacterized protein n=1 Tax=Amborella trichopoda TaxID=13333 RepID=W1P6W5_AMBTC|nr:uncharacterized protein LOC18433809 [Amborella trichopoda]ERN05632.1 hypothetical protein AMTR_s00006p00083160 [Amborella trichopoda]|eukprot:XP_006843957.1 uncharacterized protein LOC18433809 [Amborella trichopoda]